MTKNIVILASIFSTFAHAMETISLVKATKTSLSLRYNNTEINLTKGPLSSAPQRKNQIIIVGGKQQELLSGKFSIYHISDQFIANLPNGTPVYGPSVSLYEKDDESASDDDAYTLYPYHPDDKKEKLWKSSYKTTSSSVGHITEPCINESEEGFTYYVCRQNPNDFWGQSIAYLIFTDDNAIQEASKDLDLCYTEILKICPGYSKVVNPEVRDTRTQPTKNINLVIPALSVDVGFPRETAAPIAIAAIFNFLQDYPSGYDSINFVVKKRSDFALYKKLLMEYYKPIHAICLLYCLHRDNTHFLFQIPDDVINYITNLMYNR